METKRDAYSFGNAVDRFAECRISSGTTSIWFSGVLQDSRTKYYVECGPEHDGGISISVNSGTPLVRWFVRPSIREMVELLIAADHY